MTNGYIQIINFNNKYKILFTPNEEFINNDYDIIDTFKIEFNKIFSIFSHANNINLIGKIIDGYLTVIGDGSKLLLLQEIPVTYNIDLASGRTLVVRSEGVIGYIPSTIKAKKNIESISNINWLYQLNPVNFNYRKKDDENNYTEEVYEQKEYGLIAEEVNEVNRDFVFYDKEEDGSIELKGVHYEKLIPVLVKAIQELKAEINEQQQTINSLINR